MKNKWAIWLIPPIAYISLWILGSVAFLIYFRVFAISMALDYTGMIQQLPPILTILTVPVCCFIAFFVTARVIFARVAPLDSQTALRIGVASLIFTIALDLLISVAIEKIDILAFPVNLMYLLAWIAIIPTIFLAHALARRKGG